MVCVMGTPQGATSREASPLAQVVRRTQARGSETRAAPSLAHGSRRRAKLGPRRHSRQRAIAAPPPLPPGAATHRTLPPPPPWVDNTSLLSPPLRARRARARARAHAHAHARARASSESGPRAPHTDDLMRAREQDGRDRAVLADDASPLQTRGVGSQSGGPLVNRWHCFLRNTIFQRADDDGKTAPCTIPRNELKHHEQTRRRIAHNQRKRTCHLLEVMS